MSRGYCRKPFKRACKNNLFDSVMLRLKKEATLFSPDHLFKRIDQISNIRQSRQLNRGEEERSK